MQAKRSARGGVAPVVIADPRAESLDVASDRPFTMHVTPWRRTRSRWHGPSCLPQGVSDQTLIEQHDASDAKRLP